MRLKPRDLDTGVYIKPCVENSCDASMIKARTLGGCGGAFGREMDIECFLDMGQPIQNGVVIGFVYVMVIMSNVYRVRLR